MVPIMLQAAYRANGWLGMLLGTRVRFISYDHGAGFIHTERFLWLYRALQLWYGFFGRTLEDGTQFNLKIGELCRELGLQNKRMEAQALAPVSTPVSGQTAESCNTNVLQSIAPPTPAAGSPSARPQSQDFTPTIRQDPHQPAQGLAQGWNEGYRSLNSNQLAAAASPQLSEGFWLLERERVEVAERTERADRAAAAERRELAAERERAAERAERELRLVVAAAMVVCASAVACVAVMRSQ
jgi:hypothetical protein